jgi:RNA polymerase sigma-70 factor (ECF subfamily)
MSIAPSVVPECPSFSTATTPELAAVPPRLQSVPEPIMNRPADGHRLAHATDEEFVSELYERFGRRLLTFVAGFTHDWHWAEDIVQTTMTRAWRSRQKLAGMSATGVCSWLFTVAHHIFIDEYRARSARPLILAGEDARAPGAGDDIDRLMSSVVISQALTLLPEPQRQVIIDTFFRQLSILESAQSLGIPVGTVKSRLHYGLRALRKALEERGSDSSAAATKNDQTRPGTGVPTRPRQTALTAATGTMPAPRNTEETPEPKPVRSISETKVRPATTAPTARARRHHLDSAAYSKMPPMTSTA